MKLRNKIRVTLATVSRVTLILTMVSMVACDNAKKNGKWQDTMTTGMVPVAIDDSYTPIIKTQIDVFETIYPQAGIYPIFTSETDALQLLLDDSVRLAIVSRRLTDLEKEAFKQRKRFPQEWQIATDAIALVVNKNNPDTLISVSTLKKILSGEITKWSELNPKSPLKGEINIVFDNNQSGTLRYVIDSICMGDKLSANVFAQKRNMEVIDYVEESPHALGLIGVNWVGNNSDTTRLSFNERVNVMAVSKDEFANSENSYQPYQAYIALRKYPLIREVYAILNDPKTGLSTGFTSFMSSERGQKIILKSGLIPATQQVRIVNITK